MPPKPKAAKVGPCLKNKATTSCLRDRRERVAFLETHCPCVPQWFPLSATPHQAVPILARVTVCRRLSQRESTTATTLEKKTLSVKEEDSTTFLKAPCERSNQSPIFWLVLWFGCFPRLTPNTSTSAKAQQETKFSERGEKEPSRLRLRPPPRPPRPPRPRGKCACGGWRIAKVGLETVKQCTKRSRKARLSGWGGETKHNAELI